MPQDALAHFHLHVGSNVSALVEALAEVLHTAPSADPMVPETIVVQGPGMAHWLTLELASCLGIAAHHDHPTPRRILDLAFSSVLRSEDIEARRAYDANRLTWAVAATLPEVIDEPAMAPLKRYVGRGADDPRGFKPLQLARRVAVAFDDYAVYRPDMVLAWDKERDEGPDRRPLADDQRWQPALWRAVGRSIGPDKHFAARWRRFCKKLSPASLSGRSFPERLCLFGLSSLPPSYVEAFAALAEQGGVEVHFFLLTPSLRLWRRIHAQGSKASEWLAASPEKVEAQLGPALAHPLLASQARVAIGLQITLGALAPRAHVVEHGGAAAVAGTEGNDSNEGPPSLLRRMQAGLRAGTPPGPDAHGRRPQLHPEDDSLRVHSCHGPMREVEVLRDQILDWLRRDESLAPSDIVVLAPEIERYAPYIEVAFGGSTDAPDAIPFRIADRSPVAGDAVALAFGRVLDVLRGRLSAPDVADLLDLAPVRARFGIATESVDALRERVREAGVRWGADGAHRAAVEQPALEVHTWRFGLDRLLLGRAWAGDGSRLFAGALPVEDVEGGEAEQVGCLADLCETLFAFRERIGGRRTLGAWRDLLDELLEATVRPAWDEAWQAERLRQALDRLVERAEDAGFGEEVDLDIVRAELDKAIADESSARGFITGALTFCALVPMRSVPFRCIALLGLSDETFPHTDRRAGFDLIEAAPRLGDLAPREVDRAMALEALLAARERLAITYVGQSQRDNRVLPPSVVVSELLDVAAALVDPPTWGDDTDAPVERRSDGSIADAGAATEDARAAAVREALLVQHAIQPFSPRYFSHALDERARHFSYAQRYVGSAGAVGGRRTAASAFFTSPLPEEDDDEPGTAQERPTVSTTELSRFLENPARHLLQRRLGLYLGADLRPLEGREPFALDGLARWRVGDTLLPHLLEGQEADEAFDRIAATGWLPPGMPGRLAFESVARDAEAIVAAARALGAGEEGPPLRFRLPLGEVVLTGILRDLRPEARVRLSFASAGGKRELAAWIEHLAMCLLREGLGELSEVGGEAIAPEGAQRRLPARSILVARGKPGASVVAFDGAQEPAERLRELLALLEPGWRWPLPLFERASRSYAEVREKGKSDTDARKKAGGSYRSSEYGGWRDQDDAYVFQAWGEADPTLRQRAAGPALATLRELGAGPDDAQDALTFAALAQQVYGPILRALRELTP